jgi:hydroxyacylglutathione hydrolase
MTLQIRQFPCLSDNYGFLVRDEASGQVAAIDAPDAATVLRALDDAGWSLAMILNTHWHPDHAGGNAEVKAATGAQIVGPGEVRRISVLDREVGEGDRVLLGETAFDVIDTPGHTAQHISYHDVQDQVAFVGDTLFALGCGRLFEGDAATLWASLQKLAALPDETRVYCAHEYTASNARFALSVDDSQAVRERAEAVFAARDRGEPTVPTTIGLEKATNPFLRAPQLAGAVGAPSGDPVAAFAALRQAKDTFR